MRVWGRMFAFAGAFQSIWMAVEFLATHNVVEFYRGATYAAVDALLAIAFTYCAARPTGETL